MEDQEILKTLKSVDKKIGIIVGDIIKRRTTSVKEQVNELSKLEMSNSEIAEILGISSIHVAKEKSIAKKRSKK